MDVLTEKQHRALAFVAATNAGGYQPTSNEIELWLKSPVPRPPRHIFDIVHETSTAGMVSAMLGSAETTVSHLQRLGWLAGEEHSGLHLTKLGRSLLKSVDSSAEEVGEVVVLDNDDPLAYATLIGAFANLGDALVVDPYLDLDTLVDLVQYTQIRRVLVGDKQGYLSKRARLGVYLKGSPDESLDVRTAAGLHDRYVVSEDGRVWTIGMSLNGVNKRSSKTVLTPLPRVAAEHVSESIEGYWKSADWLVAPDNDDE